MGSWVRFPPAAPCRFSEDMLNLKKEWKNVFACTVGSTLEWFDYTLYGTFATTLSKLFFPVGDDAVSRMWIYLVFAVGFFSRPLGGLFFGHIGDKLGRRLTLIASIITMSVPTFLIGLLPTYEQIGVWAPVALVCIRLVQGVAIGGEFTGAMVYLVEQAPSSRRGFFGSWSDFGSPLGVLLGLFVSFILTSNMDFKAFEEYGWRIPFLLSMVVAIFGAYLRYGIEESESFKKTQKNQKKESMPIIETITKHKTTVLYAIAVCAYGGVMFYMLLTYLHNHLKVADIVSHTQASLFTTLTNVFMTIAIPFGGFLSDKFGRKNVMMSSIVVSMCVVFPMFSTLSPESIYWHLFFEIICGTCLGIFFGGRAAFYSETFPSHIRCTAVSLAFGISHPVFAGTTPLVSEFLMKITGSTYSLAIMLMVFSAAALIAMSRLEDRTGKELL